MSRIKMTEQSVDPATPSQDNGKKTVVVFAKDDGAGTTILASKDSAGNVGDFVGPQGAQGDQGDQGDQGPAGTVNKLSVADLSNPASELASQGGTTGDPIFCFEDIDPAIGTQYIFDSTITAAVNVPYIVQGSGGRWIATIHKFSNSGIDILGNILVGGLVDGRDVATDGTKLDGIESGATADQTAGEIKTAYESNANTNEFSDAEQTKLTGIEASATADQSNSEIKTAYEANTNTNAFTDAEQTKLTGIETAATADQTNGEIKTAYEANADTNEFSDAEQTKLAGIEASATADQTAAEIKTSYESNADTNEFSDAEQTKLAGLSAGFTFAILGGSGNVGGTTQASLSKGNNSAIAGFSMIRAGQIIGLGVALTTARTAGTLDFRVLINGVVQNGAGEFVTIDATNTLDNNLELATPIAYSAGDVIDIECNTTSFSPTTAKATGVAYLEDT